MYKESMKFKNLLLFINSSVKKINNMFLFLLIAYVVISRVVGGFGLAVLLTSVLISASIMSFKSEFLITRSSLIFSYLIHMIWLSTYFTFGISFARNYLGFLFRDYVSNPIFHPLTYQEGPEFSRLGSLLILAAPSLFLFVKSIYKRGNIAKPGNKRKWGDGTFAAWATLLPYVYVAVIKLQNPWEALNFVMSGDSRNHFEFVEEIRTTSHTTLSLRHVGVPVLGNAISALLSAANGAHGLLDVRDIWGLQSMYTFSAGILTAVAAVFLTTFFKGNRFADYLVLIIPISLLSVFVSSTGYIAFPILYDGFFSLYFGFSILALVLCYFFLAIEQRSSSSIVILILATWCVATSYTYLAPASLITTIFFTYLVWGDIRLRKWKIYSGVCVAIFAPIAVFLLKRQFIAEFELRGQMPGSVWATDAKFVLVLFLVSLLLITVCEGAIRKFFTCITFVIAGTVAILIYSEFLPANRGTSYSYYSSKLIIGTVGALFVLVPLLISFVFKTTVWKTTRTNKSLIKKFIAVASISALPLVMAHTLNTHNVVVDIHRGWLLNPDARSISTVINNWGLGPRLYFQFAKSDDLYEYPSAAADRMLNFWSPLFWQASGEYESFYTWAYTGQSSSDPSILCALIKSKPIVVVTRNIELPALVNNACGPSETKYEIYK